MLEVYGILGCKSITTSTYHPQTNGQTERFNRAIISALRSYTAEHISDWYLYAETFTYAYNTQVHSSTGIRPFDLVLSRSPDPLAIEESEVMAFNND